MSARRYPRRRVGGNARPLVVGAAVVAVVAGCTDVSGAQSGTQSDDAAVPSGATTAPTGADASYTPAMAITSDGATLLVSTSDDPSGFEAIVSGTLGRNEQGCVTIGDRVAIAPKGSTFTDTGGVSFEGYASYDFGEDVELGGGESPVAIVDLVEDDPIRDCVSPGSDEVDIFFLAPVVR